MNLEHLCRTIKENYWKLKNKKKTFLFLRYQFELLAWKKQKLKLGAVAFEIKKITFAEITLHEETDIRYIRQDTSHDDALKIENRLKALGWQWDFKNIGAFIVVFIFASTLLYAHIYIWYCENLPTLAFRDPNADDIIYYTLENTLVTTTLTSFKTLLPLNYWLTNTLTNFCIHYDVLF